MKKCFIVMAALSGISFGVNAQKLSDFEKQLQMKRTRHFPYCGKLGLGRSFPDPIAQGHSLLVNYRAIDVGQAEVVIYNQVGRIISIRNIKTGVGEFEIHGSELKPGEYSYALVVDGRRVFKRKLTIL